MSSPTQPSLFGAPASSLDELRQQARICQRCPLWEIGTQTVFGAGPPDTRVVIVGEAPGETEDRRGEPFVGAAGRLLTSLMESAGLDRSRIYITNSVKHRPSEPNGRGRRNRAPRQPEINACLSWLEAELKLIRPKVILCLGATAARVILGKDFRLTQQRGQWLASSYAPRTMATLHPASLLRQVGAEAEALGDQVLGDLREVARKAMGG